MEEINFTPEQEIKPEVFPIDAIKKYNIDGEKPMPTKL